MLSTTRIRFTYTTNVTYLYVLYQGRYHVNLPVELSVRVSPLKSTSIGSATLLKRKLFPQPISALALDPVPIPVPCPMHPFSTADALCPNPLFSWNPVPLEPHGWMLSWDILKDLKVNDYYEINHVWLIYTSVIYLPRNCLKYSISHRAKLRFLRMRK